MIGFYRQRAHDVGLVVVEAAAVRADGRILSRGLGLWKDEQVSGVAQLAAAIKRERAGAVLEINHAGARSLPIDSGICGASPSGYAFRPDVEPTVINVPQIREFVRD